MLERKEKEKHCNKGKHLGTGYDVILHLVRRCSFLCSRFPFKLFFNDLSIVGIR